MSIPSPQSDLDTGAVLDRWVAAELAGNVPALEQLLAADFLAVGPLGFLLTREDWLERHSAGALTYTSFGLQDLQIRRYGNTAVVVAKQTGDGDYQGHPVPEATRITIVLAIDGEAAQLVAVHYSFLAGTRGAPPIPGRPADAGQPPAGTPGGAR